MDIKVVKGAGEASIPLSAFDAALKDAGIYNYNLITLSSVIPPGSKVQKTDDFKTPDSEWGISFIVLWRKRGVMKPVNLLQPE